MKEEASQPSKEIEAPAPQVEPYGDARSAVPEVKAEQGANIGAAPEIAAPEVTVPDGAAHGDTDVSMAHVSAKKDPPIGSAVVPFIGKPSSDEKAAAPDSAPSNSFDLFKSRGMQAALIAVFVGLGWAAAGSFFGPHTSKTPVQQQTAAAVVPDATDAKRLTDEVRALKKELDALRSSVAQNAAPEELRSLKRSVENVKSGLETTKSEVSTSIAQLSGKLDRVQHEPAKLREISDRLDHIEHGAPAPTTTATIAPVPREEAPVKPVPLPPAKAQPQAPAQQAQSPSQPQSNAPVKVASANPAPAAPEKPQLLTNWVVRDVYHGIALVEGPHGSIEVIPGETIPGAGTVKSIEKRGTGWIVLTSRGLVDSAH